MSAKSNRRYYRADIDGLRAVAVIAVILFHTGLSGASGGFVGVDIFFVISGFLITSILLSEIDQQRFSLSSFYERRIRRIFPALFAVVLFTIVVATIVFLPKAYQAFGESVVAANLFVSNLFFWSQAGYFDAPAATKPLLHTWSLAVEEQFYIFFPLFLVAISRYAKKRFVFYTTFILIISLALSSWGAVHKPHSTFYLAPTRAWELMLGALLAMGAVKPLRFRWAREILAATGLCLIGWSIVTFSVTTTFPGLNALYPCIGATLLIYTGANGGTSISKLLSAQALVFIGLISYSLYLWHWPVIVFARYYEIEPLSNANIVALLVAVLLVSAFSWKYIEQPFRKKGSIMSRRALFGTSGVAIIAFATIGAGIAVTGGWPDRFAPRVRSIAAVARDTNPDSKWYRDKPPTDIRSGNVWLIGAKDKAPPSFLVWGDSHADAIEPSINSMAHSLGLSGWIVARGGCPPVVGVIVGNEHVNPCAENSNATMDFIASHKVKDVVLVAWWPAYMPDEDVFVDTTSQQPQTEPAKTAFAHAFGHTLRKLHELGVSVNVIAPLPGATMDVPSALARSIVFSKDINISPTEAEYRARNRWFLDLLTSHAAQIASISYPDKFLCNERPSCQLTHKGLPIYRDNTHLSTVGARFLDPLVRDLFKSMKASDRLQASR